MPCATCLKKSALCEYAGVPADIAQREASQEDEGSASGVGEKQQDKAGPSGYFTAANSGLGDDQLRNSTIATPSLNPTSNLNSTASSIPVLLEAYFAHVYPLPSYAFLHPPTISKRYTDGTIETCLLNSIAAVSSVRAPGTVRCPTREAAWIQEAETLIWQNLESPSIARLQAMLLIILYRAETGQLRRAFMLASLAGRAATAMRLNHERPNTTGVSLEVRRRLMWSLKLVERYFSVGLPEFELCPVENIYIQLPCVEYQFSAETPEAWEAADDQGSYHISVKLEMFRRDVMKLNRSLALCDTPFPQLPKLMNDFQQHLDRIGTQLPDRPSQAHLENWLQGRWLPRYLIMRLSFHQIHIDLYRLLLRNFRDAAPVVVLDSLGTDFLNRAETLCIQHAIMAVETIAALNKNLNQDPPRLLEFDTAICAYTASRMLLFTARFGTTPERPSEEFALDRAEMCLASVQRFFPRSMLVRPIIEELRRLIKVFDQNDRSAPSRFSSPKPSGASLDRDPTTQLSSAARIRQRLAIHSLLRQANFVDEEDEQEERLQYPPPVSSAPPVDEPMANTTVLPTTEPAAASLSSPYSQGTSAYTDHSMNYTAPAATTPSMADNSPDTQGDNEVWSHWFFEGGDPMQESMDVSAGMGLNQRSFTFPWLQREESDLIPQNLPYQQ